MRAGCHLSETVGLLETTGLTPTLAAVDAMEKAGDVRVIQCELNDFYGVCTKIAGSVSAVTAAIEAGDAWPKHGWAAHRRCHPACIRGQWRPSCWPASTIRSLNKMWSFSRLPTVSTEKSHAVSQPNSAALGLIETRFHRRIRGH